MSPNVVPSAKETLGPSSGAITIAPTTTATLSRMRPIAATIADRATITTYTYDNVAPDDTS
jgi:hypothetical protein